jgi:hypothetical protein
MISTGKRRWKLLSISYFTEINKGGLEFKKELRKDFTLIYLLKRKELLVLHLHHSSRDVVASEMLPELDPSEGVTVPSWVRLPPIESGASQLPCCVQNSLPVVALSDIQLALHRMKLVVRLKWISHMGERQRVTPQKVRTPVAGLLRWRRWRLSVDLLQSLNGVVQSGHHLHLELEELLRSQG